MSTNGYAPQEFDIVKMHAADLGTMIRAFDHAMDQPLEPEADSEHPRVLHIADYMLSETVRVIRLGTYPEIADAGAHMAWSVSRRSNALEEQGRELVDPFKTAFNMQDSASLMLAAASSPASRGGEYTVLRSFGGLAAKALSIVAAEQEEADKGIEVAHLHSVLDEQKDGGVAFGALQTSGLIEVIPGSGRAFLGPRARVRDDTELMALTRAYASLYDASKSG